MNTRKLISLTLAALLAIWLSGCKGKAEEPTEGANCSTEMAKKTGKGELRCPLSGPSFKRSVKREW